MAREHKFRGRRLDKGEWVYGWYFEPTIDQLIFGKSWIAPIDGTSIIRENHNVDPETVGEFTGMILNGTEIYEGDIIRVDKFHFTSSWPLPDILNVVYDGGCFELYRGDENLMGLRAYLIKEGEVIGNIHDTPLND